MREEEVERQRQRGCPFKLSQGTGMYTKMHSRVMTLNEEEAHD
jgi:hypothetical protein